MDGRHKRHDLLFSDSAPNIKERNSSLYDNWSKSCLEIKEGNKMPARTLSPSLYLPLLLPGCSAAALSARPRKFSLATLAVRRVNK